LNIIKFVILGIAICPGSFIQAATAQDLVTVEGVEWVSTITHQSTACKNIGQNIDKTHTYVILAKTEKEVVVVHRKSGISYYGKVDTENPMLIHYWASYLKDGGVVTERLQFKKSDDTNGEGRSEWNWSDGLMSCGGQYSFTATKVIK
jgi:hypothetical protein